MWEMIEGRLWEVDPMEFVMSLSGGLDSAVALHDVLLNGHKCRRAVAFNYGSKHNAIENAAAAEVARHFGVPFTLIDLTQVFKDFRSALLLSGDKLPTGHYEEENMRATVVPGRNMIFASILAGLAESLECQKVVIGVHAGDHFIYPDCRPEFVMAMSDAMHKATDGKVSLYAPLLMLTKKHIVGMGIRHGTPFDKTRTCYTDGMMACGRCGSCQERLEAFALNGIVDPLEYESRELLPKKI